MNQRKDWWDEEVFFSFSRGDILVAGLAAIVAVIFLTTGPNLDYIFGLRHH